MDSPCILLGVEDESLARELIDCLFVVNDQVRAELKVLLRELDVTDAQAEALWRLSGDGPMTARRMAERLNCDASTATAMVDRLQRQGLVRRVAHATDRRVKLLQLTPRGCELRERLVRYAVERSPFARLDRDSQARLHVLLAEASGLGSGEIGAAAPDQEGSSCADEQP